MRSSRYLGLLSLVCVRRLQTPSRARDDSRARPGWTRRPLRPRGTTHKAFIVVLALGRSKKKGGCGTAWRARHEVKPSKAEQIRGSDRSWGTRLAGSPVWRETPDGQAILPRFASMGVTAGVPLGTNLSCRRGLGGKGGRVSGQDRGFNYLELTVSLLLLSLSPCQSGPHRGAKLNPPREGLAHDFDGGGGEQPELVLDSPRGRRPSFGARLEGHRALAALAMGGGPSLLVRS
jgi:hypothetical protein